MKKHSFRMLLGCVIPLLLIFILPSFLGGGGRIPLFVILIVCFVMHLFMIGGNHGKEGDNQEGHHGVH